MSAVVAKGNIPAGTTGQSMISNNLVAIELIPTKSFKPTDLTTLAVLPNEVSTQSGHQGSGHQFGRAVGEHVVRSPSRPAWTR